jgi:hypothetical protein
MLDIDEHGAAVLRRHHAGDFLAERAGEETPDLSGSGIGAEHCIVAERLVATLVQRDVADVGLDPQPSRRVEPQSVRAGE